MAGGPRDSTFSDSLQWALTAKETARLWGVSLSKLTSFATPDEGGGLLLARAETVHAIAKAYGTAPTNVSRLLDRVTANPTRSCSSLSPLAVVDIILRQARQAGAVEQVLSALDSGQMQDIIDGCVSVQALAATLVPDLHSLRELAALSLRLAAALDAQKESAVQTGHSLFRHIPCSFLEPLAVTYPVRTPARTRDLAGSQSAAPTPADSTERWQPVDHDWGANGYSSAPLLPGFSQEEADLADAIRGKVLDLKLRVLRACADELNAGRDPWDTCSNLVSAALQPDERVTCRKLDRRLDDNGRTLTAQTCLAASGIWDLLSFVWHCHGEAFHGYDASVRQTISDLVKTEPGGWLALNPDNYFLLEPPASAHVRSAWAEWNARFQEVVAFRLSFRQEMKKVFRCASLFVAHQPAETPVTAFRTPVQYIVDRSLEVLCLQYENVSRSARLSGTVKLELQVARRQFFCNGEPWKDVTKKMFAVFEYLAGHEVAGTEVTGLELQKAEVLSNARQMQGRIAQTFAKHGIPRPDPILRMWKQRCAGHNVWHFQWTAKRSGQQKSYVWHFQAGLP